VEGKAARTWAATSSWRGDLKFFGRIVQRARDEVRDLGHPDPCRIEFAVGPDDVESYESVEEMLALVPPSTLQKFSSARVRVGSEPLCVQMCFGRGKFQFRKKAAFTCASGITIEASSDGAVSEVNLERVRNSVAAVLERGAFFWARKPTRGPRPGGPTLEEARAKRWNKRESSALAAFFVIAIALWSAWTAVGRFARAEGEDLGVFSEEPDPTFIGAVAGIGSVLSVPFSTLIFPAIDIADVTPGRRLLQTVSRSGVVTTVVGLVVKGLFSG
jgi:hypothetical protein